MATKVTILGEQPIEQEKKKIEFVTAITITDGVIRSYEPKHAPHLWGEVVLLSRKYHKGEYDLMFAHDFNNKGMGCLYLGHFNDGIV